MFELKQKKNHFGQMGKWNILKQHAFRLKLIFNEKLENGIKCILSYSNQKELFYTLSMAVATHVYYKKRSKYAQKKALTALVTQ
jgi:hypothetical protein